MLSVIPAQAGIQCGQSCPRNKSYTLPVRPTVARNKTSSLHWLRLPPA